MRTRGPTAVAACIVVACAAQAGAAPVADGRITGRVAPPLRPASGAQTVVQAIDASSITLAATGRATRAGTYRLTVRPGVFLVAAEKLGRSTPPARGFSRLIRVASGKTASPPQITRRPQGAETGARVDGNPVLAVKEFTTRPSGIEGRALAGMLQTDLWIAGNPCVVLVEWMRRADVLAEIRLQQSKLVDPSTRVTPNLTRPDIFVEGSVSTTASSISWSVRMREIRTGRIVARDSGRVPWARYLDVSGEIAKRLLEQLGADCLPRRIEGSFSGELTVAGTTTFTGKVRFDRIEPPPTRGLAEYRVSRVEFTTTIDGRPTCQGSATQKVTLTNVDPNLAKLVIETRRDRDKGYRYFVVSMFQSPEQRTVTFVCNGAPVTTPWIPAAGLYTGSNKYTDGIVFKGTNNELKPNTYTWDLKGSG
jgi:hypothetical protein